MPSSTSSSERDTGPALGGPARGLRRRRQWLALLTGVTSTLVCLGVTPAALRLFGWEWRVPGSATESRPAPASYYLAHDRGGHVDHHVLYHGVDRVATENLKSSDVLFLGNSRLMFALGRRALLPFFSRHGLTYYVLGFGHMEHDHFPKAIIRRFDLRPRLVIVNADRFFVGDQSAWADRVVADSWFDAQKLWFESEAAHATRHLLDRWVPHLPSLQDDRREFVAYRSRMDGTWLVANAFEGPGDPMPGSDRRPSKPDPGRLARARAFKQEVEARGGRLVLCLVPAPTASRGTAEWLASELGVPLIAPEPDGLRTHDGSHLTPESAAEFSRAFLQELEPVIRDLSIGIASSGAAHERATGY